MRMARLHLDGRVAALLLLFVVLSGRVAAVTRSQDVNALNSLRQGWTVPSGQLSNWGVKDPCSTPWTGVTCDPSNETVTRLTLDQMNITGTIGTAIGNLTGLTELELSQNPGLTGSLPHEIGNLVNLNTLSIQFCSLNESLPVELGQLTHLQFLGLNGNQLTGSIPGELGSTNLTWMDVSMNQLSGQIPIGNGSTLGVNNITSIAHFHFWNNSLSGNVPKEIFSLPNILHLLLDNNKFNGSLPNITDTGFSTSLQVIWLDFNQLTGQIPEAYGQAVNLTELHLKANNFNGAVPDFSAMTGLTSLALGDNNFEVQPFPSWVPSLTGIQTLNLEGMNISGVINSSVFNLPNLQRVDLSSNDLNGALEFSGLSSTKLQTVNLENNSISGFTGQPSGPSPDELQILLSGNPICSNPYVTLPSSSCPGTFQTQPFTHPNTGSDCSGEDYSEVCGGGKYKNPYTCTCSFPLILNLWLTAPAFSNLNDEARRLEQNLASAFVMNTNQTYVDSMTYQPGSRIFTTIWIFPTSGKFLLEDISDNITNALRHHAFVIAEGPYLLFSYYTAGGIKSHFRTAVIVAIALGVSIVLCSIGLAVYFKRRADKAISANPFASWGGGNSELGEAPKLKGARWFTLAELKVYTDNWSEGKVLGIGGYGKVYKGDLPEGELVAIKRATEGSMQGATEFKNEIELLSRVHHRNLVGLIGFCYEGGEQALIYEFMPNGTLTDLLHSQKPLSWEKRCEIALESAIGINYLHDHASPPIIHRDIKSANILLNERMVAKVSDFGLSVLTLDYGEKLVHDSTVKGTLGYLDPEYYVTQNLTDKSDVYSFGVVLFELLTARPPIHAKRFVVTEFKAALNKGGISAVRPLLDLSLTDLSDGDLESFLKIALACVQEDSPSRPTSAEIVAQLQALDAVSRKKEGTGIKKVTFSSSLNGSEEIELSDFSDLSEIILLTDADTGVTQTSPTPSTRYPYENAPNSFQYSGAYGVTTTVRPK